MRELKVVGLDVDNKYVLCEDDQPSKFKLRIDDRLRAAVRGDAVRINQSQLDLEVPRTMLRPREIQARIRAGATVEQLAQAAGVDVSRIERFAHPVLLERARAAELATAAHPVLEDGPSVLTLLETITRALVSRGLDPDETEWDAWRNEDSRWTVRVAWKAGRSDNVAHFRYTPGAHGGTATAVDEPAGELIDPRLERPLRVAPAPQLDFDIPEKVVIDEPDVQPEPEPAPDPLPELEQAETRSEPTPRPVGHPGRSSGKRARPTVPAWEDVLLGVRSSGGR